MILELLRHWLTPCPAPLKRLGVLHDLIALDQRAKRQAAAWAPHRQACQDAITAMAHHASPTGQAKRAVIIGSGLLLEIPLPILAERFAEVILVDLYHLPKIARQARRYSNVTLLAHDITGLLDRLAPALAQGALPLPEVTLPKAEEAELIVSANCLSQLSGIPLAVATAKGGFSPDQCMAWERQIIASHLTALTTWAAQGRTVGLLCDDERQWTNPQDEHPLESAPLLANTPLPPRQNLRDWWWSLAPAPEESRRWSIRHHMTSGTL
jgi:hypothetical protein